MNLLNKLLASQQVVGNDVRRSGISGMLGLGGTENATGDMVKKLDLISNDAWVNSLIYSKQCAVLVSEEEEEAIIGEQMWTLLSAARHCVWLL